MGDPFSAAGTAVGITSLGIQTCQILHRYYSQYRGQDDEIDAALKQVEGLQGILDRLQQVKQRIDINGASSQLHMAMQACQEALGKLKNMADKCQATKGSDDIQARLRAARKRVLWPFRKDTLAELQTTLRGLRANLSLALQSEGLDSVLTEVTNLQPAIKTLHTQSVIIEHHQIRHADALAAVHAEVTSSSLSQRQNHQDLLHVQNQLSLLEELLRSRTEPLVNNSASRRDLSTISPSLLADATQIVENVTPGFKTSLRRYNGLVGRTGSHRTDISQNSACRCRPTKRKSTTRYGWLSIFAEEAYTHRPECPHFVHADYSRTVATQFTIYTRLIGCCVLAGWQCSRRGGWNSIAPMLRYRAIRNSSPAFKLLEDAEKTLYNREYKSLPDLLSSTSSALQRCFGKDALPTDLDGNGNGIFQKALIFIDDLICKEFDDIDSIRAFIDMCIDLGVPYDQEDAFQSTPVIYWQNLMTSRYIYGDRINQLNRDVLVHITRKLELWEVCIPDDLILSPPENDRQKHFEIISYILSIDEIRDGLDEDEPIVQAILRRSEMQLEACLKDLSSVSMESLTDNYNCTTALACWPQGVELILSNSRVKPSDNLIVMIWDSAIEAAILESLMILVDFGVLVTIKDWERLNMVLYCCFDGVIDTEKEWVKLFHDLASQILLGDSAPIDTQVVKSSEGRIVLPNDAPPLYHSVFLSTPAAKGVWLTGLYDLNAEKASRNWAKRVPPLWVHVTELGHWLSRRGLVKWFLDHGADPTWVHPSYFATSGHIIIRDLISQAVQDKSVADCDKWLDCLDWTRPDQCVCHCSRAGCSGIGCAVSSSVARFEYYRKTVKPYLFSLVERSRSPGLMASAILRVLTFEKLNLTHTCCYRIVDELCGEFQRPTPDEAKVIWDLEQADIELLNNLMEEFERSWAAYDKPFAKFVKRVWKPRMRQVRKEREINREVYEAELTRMGIVLKEFNQNEAEIDSDSDFTESEDSEGEVEGEGEGDGWYTADEDASDEERDRGAQRASDINPDETTLESLTGPGGTQRDEEH